MKARSFPRLSQQKMADFLAIKRERLAWATREGLVTREANKTYAPEIVTGQWLKYERSRMATKAGKSKLEVERVRLTKAKADAACLRLAQLNGALINPDDMIENVRTACLRIRAKLQAAIPRLSRACYHAPNATEALLAARREFDVLLSELSTLDKSSGAEHFQVVTDENGAKTQRPTTGDDPEDSAA
jgi:phage terminase Nu1 subunit (DNA packaging protein)